MIRVRKPARKLGRMTLELIDSPLLTHRLSQHDIAAFDIHQISAIVQPLH